MRLAGPSSDQFLIESKVWSAREQGRKEGQDEDSSGCCKQIQRTAVEPQRLFCMNKC